MPGSDELGERLASVLDVIYLIFNEGYAATAGDDWMRPALCEDALRLGRMLAELMPREPEVHGLVALMEIQASRSRARIGPGGEPILLLDQDRSRWDPLLMARGIGMHAVLGGFLHLDRQKGPCPDMQGQPVQLDAAAAQRRLQRGREMQSRRRRRDGALVGREHGLVVGGVAIVGRALRRDVGRQRRRAEIGDGLIQRGPMKRERQRNLALFALGLDLGIEMAEQADLAFIAEANACRRARASSRA